MKNTVIFWALMAFSWLAHCNNADLTTADKAKLVDQQVSKKYPSNGAGAAVLVLKGKEVLFEKAYGQAVIEHQVPMRTDTPFNLGSITKQFTAVAILMLQEAGKLSLNDDIKQYVPEYEQTQFHRITIKQLLSHTAGIPDYDGKNGYSHHGTDIDTFERLLNAFSALPLEFEPGTEVNYSNSGYILLGRIIERVSQMSYPEFISQHIFKKLGMKSAQFYDYYRIVPGLAKGYEVDEKSPLKIIHGKAVKPSLLGDGGIVASLKDLTKWYQALSENILISAKSLSIAQTSVLLNDGRETKTGLGWKIAKLGSLKTVEHGGNNHGFENYVIQLPEKNITVMVFTNLNRSYPGELAESIAAIVVDMPVNDRQQISLSEEQLNRFVGNYQYTDGDYRTIAREGKTLFSVRDGGVKSRLIPFADNKFYFAEAPIYWLRFERDKTSGGNVMYSESRVTPYIVARQVR